MKASEKYSEQQCFMIKFIKYNHLNDHIKEGIPLRSQNSKQDINLSIWILLNERPCIITVTE